MKNTKCEPISLMFERLWSIQTTSGLKTFTDSFRTFPESWPSARTTECSSQAQASLTSFTIWRTRPTRQSSPSLNTLRTCLWGWWKQASFRLGLNSTVATRRSTKNAWPSLSSRKLKDLSYQLHLKKLKRGMNSKLLKKKRKVKRCLHSSRNLKKLSLQSTIRLGCLMKIWMIKSFTH